ncbi:MAG TPA: acryloyl-CoA reductase [Acidimicrobiales bacterium]|jgi:acrylyl-CoA reductase (NADPH)|nr:acryloyl-CoA reductase [Acidimicrobiales bacterium]
MRAYVISEQNGQLSQGVRDFLSSPKDPSDVLVRVEYSSVNFKDAMVASAPSRVRRVAELVGGVDAAGVVEASSAEGYPVGLRVAVHGGDLGVGRDGGFATQVFSPTRYLSALPETISTRDAMVIGTAGFTAMASVLALEDRGLANAATVLVTGATGGVGSQSVTYLAAKGYQPVASTGSPDQSAWLTERGAVRVIGRGDISDRPGRVLGSELWDGAIDCVGGVALTEILRSLRYGAAVAASGLVGSAELATTVYPFITRAVALLGIDAVEATSTTRSRVWAALGAMAPRVDLNSLADRVIGLDGLDEALDDVRRGTTRGRIVVDLTQGV